MIGESKIICPNCGAENEYGGTCQYCGCALKNVGSHIVQGDEGETRAHFLNGKYKYFYEEFDNIEKITRTLCGRWKTDSAPYLSFSFCREHTSSGEERVYILLKRVPCSQYGQPTTLLFSLNGRRYSVNPTKMEKFVRSKEYIDWEVYYEIDANILKEICDVSQIDAKISFEDFQSRTVSISLQRPARLLYNRLFDNTAYADVIMEFQHKVDEKRRKRKEKFQKEREEFKRLREARIRKEEERKRQREENEKRRAEEKAKEEAKAEAERKKNKRIKNAAFTVGILLMPLVLINMIHIQNYGFNHDALHKAPIAWWIWWSALFCYIGLAIIYHRFKNKI